MQFFVSIANVLERFVGVAVERRVDDPVDLGISVCAGTVNCTGHAREDGVSELNAKADGQTLPPRRLVVL